ncbi:MAG: hypothetical protein KDK70_24515, partial [Myxococcales bacterium]|nr:hypothetical protein [Myxococcales bacterium]
DRYIYIVDRKKDMFSHQGLHVYPREVEEVIHHFEGVREVAVVGLGGDDVDEIVAVLSELSPGAIDLDGLRAHCAERLADFKLPTRYEVVESYPRTGSGKIAKHELRAQLEAERAP